MAKQVLVTGAAGFIGSHTAEALLQTDYDVVGIDNFDPYYPKWVKERNLISAKQHDRYTFHEGDFTDTSFVKRLFETFDFSHVVHLGAKAGVRNSVREPLQHVHVNCFGTTVLLEQCTASNVENVVIASSSSVYGMLEKTPFKETDQLPGTISPYAATKLMMETMARTYHVLYNLHVSCLRFFTVYGPRSRPDMAPYLFLHRISEGKPIAQYGDGTTGRDYTYISDIVSGILAAVERTHQWGFEIFNLGNSSPVLLSDFISTIEEIVGLQANITVEQVPLGDVPITFADITKARQMLGYQPKTTLADGMRHAFDWYKELDKALVV